MTNLLTKLAEWEALYADITPGTWVAANNGIVSDDDSGTGKVVGLMSAADSAFVTVAVNEAVPLMACRIRDDAEMLERLVADPAALVEMVAGIREHFGPMTDAEMAEAIRGCSAWGHKRGEFVNADGTPIASAADLTVPIPVSGFSECPDDINGTGVCDCGGNPCPGGARPWRRDR